MLCVEMEEDKHLDGRHAIEEAMSAYPSYPILTTTDPVFQHTARALMRNCPKCQKGTRSSLSPPFLHVRRSVHQGNGGTSLCLRSFQRKVKADVVVVVVQQNDVPELPYSILLHMSAGYQGV